MIMDLDEMSKTIEDIEKEIETAKNASLKDIKKCLLNRDMEGFKAVFEEKRHLTAADKIFHHYKNREKKDSEINILYSSDEYLVIRSEMYSEKKKYHSDEKDGKYHGVWILGNDEDSGYFLHRLPWSRSFENEDEKWTKEKILRKLGIDGHLEDNKVPRKEKSWRVQGDILLTREDYKSYKTGLKKSISDNIKDDLKKELRKKVRDELPDSIWPSTYSSGINVEKNLSTDELKELQNKLDISEEKIREMQNSDEIQRLHPSRRRKYITNIISKRIKKREKQFLEEQDIDKRVKEKYKKQIKKKIEEAGQINVAIGNRNTERRPSLFTTRQNDQTPSHVAIFSKAWRETYPISDDWIIVPDESKLLLLHDEHQNRQLTLPPGKYQIDALRHHRRR